MGSESKATLMDSRRLSSTVFLARLLTSLALLSESSSMNEGRYRLTPLRPRFFGDRGWFAGATYLATGFFLDPFFLPPVTLQALIKPAASYPIFGSVNRARVSAKVHTTFLLRARSWN